MTVFDWLEDLCELLPFCGAYKLEIWNLHIEVNKSLNLHNTQVKWEYILNVELRINFLEVVDANGGKKIWMTLKEFDKLKKFI